MDNTEDLYVSRQNVATNSIYGESDDLDPNEFMELETPVLGQLSLVRKKTLDSNCNCNMSLICLN